jgi:hypothetical protein
MQSAIAFPVSLKDSAQPDLTGRDHLELVYAAKQGGLPRSGRADGDTHLASRNVQIHATQSVEVSVEFVDAEEFNGGRDCYPMH